MRHECWQLNHLQLLFDHGKRADDGPLDRKLLFTGANQVDLRSLAVWLPDSFRNDLAHWVEGRATRSFSGVKLTQLEFFRLLFKQSLNWVRVSLIWLERNRAELLWRLLDLPRVLLCYLL